MASSSASGSRPLLRELVDSTVAGCAYGATAVLLSHPLDTIKTRQQTVYFHRPSAAAKASGPGAGPLEACLLTWRQGGLAGLYAGLAPSFVGSVAFRSLPFVAYNFTSKQLRDHLPALAQRLPVFCAFLAGASGGVLRSLVECPLEVAKVRKQAGLRVRLHLRALYAGAALTVARNVGAIGLFWAFVEASRDLRQGLFGRYPAANSFAAGGGCSCLAWVCIFPVDLVKSQAQAQEAAGSSSRGATAAGATEQRLVRRSAWATARDVVRARGFGGLYQGLSAGLARSFLANGCSMVVYDWARAALLGLH